MREITTHMLMIKGKVQINQFTQITPHKQKPTGKVISTIDMISFILPQSIIGLNLVVVV